MAEPILHPIKVVARRSGLSPHVIRVWERRYAAVAPQRSASRRRLYSEAEIDRLTLLRRVTEAGHGIGRVAQLPDSELKQLLVGDARARAVARHPAPAAHRFAPKAVEKPAQAVRVALQAVENLEGFALESLLNQAAIVHSQPVVLDEIIVPIMNEIGDRWRDGSLRPVHEHLASVIVRNFLASLGGAYAADETSPLLVVTTPTGQLHEIGALLAMTSAAADGWRTTYLGPNLPAEEIAAAAAKHGARAVALSVVYPTDDARLRRELVKLRRGLGPATALLVGGRAAPAYRASIREVDGLEIKDLPQLRAELEALRSRG